MYKDDLQAAHMQIETQCDEIADLKVQISTLINRMRNMMEKPKKKPIPNLGWIILTWIIGLCVVGTAVAGGLAYPELQMYSVLWRTGLALSAVLLVCSLVTAGILGKFEGMLGKFD